MSTLKPGIIDEGFYAAIESASTGVVLSDASQPGEPLVYANPAFEQLSGYSRAEILGKNCRFLQGPETSPDAVEAIGSAVEHRRSVTIRLLNYRKNRETFWNELTISPVTTADRGFLGFVGIQKDVTEEVKAQQQLMNKIEVLNATRLSLEEARREIQNLADRDELTGTASRKLFFDRLNQALARSRRTEEKLAVILMDLDGFKSINDRFGHEGGDDALRIAAERMRGQIRESDTLARMGGDEFLLLMDTGVNDAAVAEVARRLRSCFGLPFDIGGNSTALGVSLGTAVFPHHGEDARALVRHADVKMYEDKAGDTSKRTSRGRCGGNEGPRYIQSASVTRV